MDPECLLFQNISPKSCIFMLQCLNAQQRYFHDGESICNFGKNHHFVGIIQSGSAKVVRLNYNGSRTILEHLEPGNIFGEMIAFTQNAYEHISVICEKSCDVLFIDYWHIIKPCCRLCDSHTQMLANFLALIAKKTYNFGERIEVLSQRSIRSKLLCYFSQIATKNHSFIITLPFSMTDFADYLAVDRSAMMRELKKMKEEGLLNIKKRKIELLIGDIENF